MFKKIHFDDKAIILCEKVGTKVKGIMGQDYTILENPDWETVEHTIKQITTIQFTTVAIVCADVAQMYMQISTLFTPIAAAGGLVQNEAKAVLFIYRLGKWDLPKGKIEQQEGKKEAALREVEEETRAQNLRITKKITETYHTYEAHGKHYLKTTYWYHFIAIGEQHLKPQVEENITALEWVPTSNIKIPMENTYASIKEVVAAYFDEP